MPKVLTVGSPWRVILAFAVPLLIGNVVQQLYQVTDAFVVGRTLGVDALAAVGSTGGLTFLLLGFAWGLTSGFAIPTAQAFGAGDLAGVRRSVVAGTLLTAATSVVLTAGAIALTGPALQLLRTPAELVPQARAFAIVSFAGATATMFFNYLSAIIRAIGDSRTPLLFLAICCGLNVVLVIVLVRGVGLGVGGAALATICSQAVSVVLCVGFVLRHVPALHVGRHDWHPARKELLHHLRLGLPMGFQASIIAIGALAVQLRLNEIGPDAVAAYTTASRVDGLAVTFLASLGLAVSTYVAQNHGGLRPDRILLGVRQSVVMAVVCAVGLGVLLVTGGSAIVALFVGPGEGRVVAMAAQMLTVNGCLYSMLGILFVLRGSLQGLGRTLIPTVTGAIELVMRVTAAAVLGAAFGYTGVVWGNALAWIGAVVLLVPAYRRARSVLASTPVGVDGGAARGVEPVVVEGPVDGSMVIDAVVPHPSGSPAPIAPAAPERSDAAV